MHVLTDSRYHSYTIRITDRDFSYCDCATGIQTIGLQIRGNIRVGSFSSYFRKSDLSATISHIPETYYLPSSMDDGLYH